MRLSEKKYGGSTLFKNVILSCVSLVVFLLVAEAALYLRGFNYAQTPQVMKKEYVDRYISGQNKYVESQHFVRHRTKMWAPEPNFGKANADGYQGTRLPVERTPGLKRILFLGDSCTNSGLDHYPEKVIEKLENKYGIKAEALIAGVGGYTTFQGALYFEESLEYSPDVVVAYFGWNDHWLAQGGVPDNEFKGFSTFNLTTDATIGKLRTYQLIHYLVYPPMEFGYATGYEKVMQLLRVPPEYYSANIVRMIGLAAGNNSDIYFVAAPMGPHVIERKRDFLLPSPLIPVAHNRYIGILKKTVAEFDNAHVVDFSDITFDRRIMMEDGIHPNEAGNDIIAERLAEMLYEGGALGG